MPTYLAICSEKGRKSIKTLEAAELAESDVIIGEEEYTLLKDFVEMNNIYPAAQRSHREGLAAQLKARLTRLFPKVYMQHINLNPLSLKDLHALNNYFVRDIEDLQRQAEEGRKFRRFLP